MLRKVAWVLALALPGVAADVERVETLIVEKTNEFRREQGLEPVRRERTLERAAQEFAEYMAKHDKYGHEADGRKPSQRARAHGYEYCLVSENISYQQTSADFGTAELAERYVEGWKASPGHRKNMREPAIVDTAAAVVKSAKTGRYYAVQMFGRPKSKGAEFRVFNATNDGVRYAVDDEAFTLRPGSTRIHNTCIPPERLQLAHDSRREGSVKVHDGDRFQVVHDGVRLILRSDRQAGS